MDTYMLWILYFNLYHALCAVSYCGLYWSTSLIINPKGFPMVQPNEVFPVLELSNDDRVRVFRKSIHGIQAFEGMEVDAYIIFTDRFLIMLDTMLCPEDVSATLQSVSTEIIGRSLLCINSHADWDHAWGNGYFTREHSAPIIAHDHCLRRMQSSEAHQELRDFQQLSPTFKNV